MPIAQIYSAIPEEVKQEFANQAVQRIGNLIVNNEGNIQGFLQSTIGLVESENIQKAVAMASQYAEVGLTANPVGMGVHAAGSFGMIAYQMEEIKGRLENISQKLDKINAKVDIGYYSKFKAAIELASHAFSMKNKENKISMAHKAVQLFVETKNIYSQYIEQELESNGRMLSEYLLIVILSYIGQVKCCLELEELETAQKILNESTPKIKSLTEKYVRLLLSDNPAIYLHNDFEDLEIDLEKLTKVYNWLGQETNENKLFKELRKNYIEIHKHQEQAFKEIPQIIWNPVLDIESKNSSFNILNPLVYFQNGDTKPFLKERLKDSFEAIEKVTEGFDRFSSIKYEVQMFANEGISYKEWQQKLKNKMTNVEELLYIELEQPIEI